MEITLQAQLDKLLNAYSHQYDIERNVTEEGFLFPATATYYLRDENYLISRQHVLSAVEQHEYLYFCLADHLTVEELQSQIDLSKRAGLGKVKPHKDHMFSNVGLVVLANTIDPEAQKLIRRTRYRKNYRLTLHGWTEYQLAERSGLPQSTISSWYRKNMVPTVASLEKICTAFGITLSQLFSEGDSPVSLTESQKKLLEAWAKLTPDQQDAVFTLLEKM